MRLSALLDGFSANTTDPDITAITEDSRRVTPGTLFVAITGTAEDGHAYVADAIARGAVAIVAERDDGIPAGAVRVTVPDSRAALATLAARFHGEPARSLHLIGFTGTFGKTSTSDILRALLAAAGGRPGVLGSLGARFQSFHEDGRGLTTPAPVELHGALRGLAGAGADTVIMEVTSHALRMRRVDGLTFGGGLLAAIKPGEHTDFHRSYEDYLDAKRLFLRYLSPDATLAYDADNPGACELAAARARGRSIGFSLEGRPADLVFNDVRLDASGARFTIAGPLVEGHHQMHSALLGTGHLRNAALALTYALAAGVDPGRAAGVLADLRPLPRRMERYAVSGRIVLDDTAAHPDSFRMAFAVAALLPRERLTVVYAARGNRGADINARNAETLADLAAEYRVDTLIVTTASEAVGDVDRVRPEELAATHDTLTRRGRAFTACGTLDDAVAQALEHTQPGDAIVLLGAQGMNQGRAALIRAAGTGART